MWPAWLWAVISMGFMAFLFDQRSRQGAKWDALAGVQARFRDLAVTRTDLLVGAALTRYPLEGMWAWVEDGTKGVTYLRVEGPTVALLRKVRHRCDATVPLAMRAWAQTLNLHARGNHQPGMSA
jgi:hypothetical protein